LPPASVAQETVVETGADHHTEHGQFGLSG
jgi:hypothetical protein